MRFLIAKVTTARTFYVLLSLEFTYLVSNLCTQVSVGTVQVVLVPTVQAECSKCCLQVLQSIGLLMCLLWNRSIHMLWGEASSLAQGEWLAGQPCGGGDIHWFLGCSPMGWWTSFTSCSFQLRQNPLVPGELLRLCHMQGRGQQAVAEARGDGKTVCSLTYDTQAELSVSWGNSKHVFWSASSMCNLYFFFFPVLWLWDYCNRQSWSDTHSRPCVVSIST